MVNSYDTIKELGYVLNNMLGPSIFFMPAAFDMSGGYILGFNTLLLVAILLGVSRYFSIKYVQKCEDDKMSRTLSDLSQKKESHLSWLLDFLIKIFPVFAGILFQKYLTNLLNQVAIRIWPTVSYTMINYSVLLLSSVCFFVLGLIQSEKFLKFFSLIRTFFLCTLFVALLILSLSIPSFITQAHRFYDPSKDYIFSFSIFVVSMFVQTNIPLLYPQSLDISINYDITESSYRALGGSLVYGIGGCLGYLILGSLVRTSELMTMFFSPDSSLYRHISTPAFGTDIVYPSLKFLVGYHAICAVGIVLTEFPLRLSPIISLCKEKYPSIDTKSTMTRALIIFPLIVFITLFNAIPNVSFDFVYELLGSTYFNFVSFLIPSLLYIFYADKKAKFKRALALIVALLSVGYSVLPLCNAIRDVLYPPKKIPEIWTGLKHQKFI